MRSISTWNAAENEHMIAVNDAIGFEVVAHSVHWLKQLERLTDRPTDRVPACHA